MSLPNRQRWFIIAAVAAVGLLLLDRIVVTPLLAHWEKRSNEITGLRETIAAGESSLARADRTRGLWKEIQDASLPRDAAVAEQTVLSSFDQWGRANRIDLGSIKPQWKRGAHSQYSLLECRVDATGSLASLTRFLYDVERSPLALRVDSIEFTSRDEQGQTLTLGLVVSGLRLAPLEAKL